MLYGSLVLSAILLCIANRDVRRKRFGGATLGWALGFAFFGAAFIFSVTFLLTAGSLLLAVLVWRFGALPARHFVAVSLVTVVGVHGLGAYWAIAGEDGVIALRKRYPLVSMELRLPEPKPTERPAALSTDADARLEHLEEKLESLEEADRRLARRRNSHLRTLHESTVFVFINSPGFGASRMPMAPTVWSLAPRRRWTSPIPQPGQHDAVWSPGDETTETADDGKVGFLHRDGVFDFVNPEGFGYIKNRQHVAGFEAHQFSEPPRVDHWAVQRLDLVGLLLHEQPIVYISEHLPRMDELKEAPTRELDLFEAVGLQSLRQGEDLFVREAEGKLRVLGSLRATKQCVTCHGGKRGDLLGAFSYTLRRVEK